MEKEEQKQVSNDTSSFELGRYISIIYRIGRWHFESSLAENQDLSSGQHSFLFYLFEHDGATQEEISRALLLDKATTARAMQKLEDRDYIRRMTSEKDKRVNHVFLTPKGWDSENELRAKSREWKAILEQGLDDEELKMTEYIIQKLSENATNYKHSVLKKGGTHDK